MYTSMESQQQLKWRNVLRDEVRETRTKDGRQTDRCYYLVIYSHLELDHAMVEVASDDDEYDNGLLIYMASEILKIGLLLVGFRKKQIRRAKNKTTSEGLFIQDRIPQVEFPT
mgnify:CR=1 FL=1